MEPLLELINRCLLPGCDWLPVDETANYPRQVSTEALLELRSLVDENDQNFRKSAC
jgi:hypothetical protein